MCGICGIVAFGDGFAVDEATVTRMRDTLVHRGPDDAGARARAASASPSVIGACRSSTCPRPGDQPMANEDGTVWITYNGEVYNHEALRAELRPRATASARAPTPRRSSTSTRRRGRTACAGSRACSRSRSGTAGAASCSSPVTASVSSRSTTRSRPAGLVFGSEIKALLEHPAIERDLDEAAFFDYLTFAFTPPPATMYRGHLEACAGRAHARARRRLSRALRATGVRSRRRSPPRCARCPRARWSSVSAICLRESIRKRMMSDVPFGVFLSGGRGLLGQRRADGGADRPAGADVRDGTRGSRALRRARLRAADRRAVRNRPPRGR